VAPPEALHFEGSADAHAAEAAAPKDAEDVSESDAGAVTEKSGAKARSMQAMLAARCGEIGEEAQTVLMNETNLLGSAGDHFVDTPDDLPSLMAG
jgi:hypothetical protein